MSLYQCYFFGEAGIQPGCEHFHSDSKTQARQIALEMLRQHPLAVRMEVWCEADLAFRLGSWEAHESGSVRSEQS